MRTGSSLLIETGLSILIPTACVHAQDCRIDFARAFAPPGFTNTVRCSVVHDDGHGPALYVGGFFRGVGDVSANGIAQWDGTEWLPLGSGMESLDTDFPYVSELVDYDDDGPGPNRAVLVAAGRFQFMGGVQADNLAQWNGFAWSTLGGADGVTSALAVIDFDGLGPQPPKLAVGGDFTAIGGVVANRIALWDGQSWSALGAGFDRAAVALSAFDDDGSGPNVPRLVAGGAFGNSGAAPIRQVAVWNDGAWVELGGGLPGDDPFPSVSALEVFDVDGEGVGPPQLYAAGTFERDAPAGLTNIVRLDGSQWATVGGGTDSTVDTLHAGDENGQPVLYVGGFFDSAGGVSASGLARWDGNAWSAVSGAEVFAVFTIAQFDENPADTKPAVLFVGYISSRIGEVWAPYLARFDGSDWSAVAAARGIDEEARTLAVFDDDGDGPIAPALYVGGLFERAGPVAARRLARWDGQNWSAVPLGAPAPSVRAIVVHDDGTGAALYVAGVMSQVNGVPARNIARWNGSSWSAVGGGIDGQVLALTVYDDGGGPALYAGGAFTNAGDDDPNEPKNSIAKWTGSAWKAVGNLGVSGGIQTVLGMTVWDADGGGAAPPVLVITGSFTHADTRTVNHVAKWDGSNWMRLGNGLSWWGDDVAAFDDGSGNHLYACGDFPAAGGTTVNFIARWNGSAWSALGSGLSGSQGDTPGRALEAFDADGAGPLAPALYVGGDFTSAGGVETWNLARWDGLNWSSINGGRGVNGRVFAMQVYDDGQGPSLFVSGLFTQANHVPSASLAKLALLGPLGDIDGDRSVGLSDLTILLSGFGTRTGEGDAAGDFDRDGDVDLADLTTLLATFGRSCQG